MLTPRNLSTAVSPRARKLLGLTCVGMSALVIFAAYRTLDPVLIIVAAFIGIPFTVIGICLLARPAKRGYGILSPLTLHAIGLLVLVGSISGLLSGQPKAGGGILFASACFFLGSKRKAQRSRWWTSDY